MKYLEFILFVSLCTLFINSCKEDTPSEPDYAKITVNSMEASVDDEIFASSSVTVSVFNTDFTKINGSAVTTGISLVLSDTQVGDYSIGGDSNENFMEYSSVSSDQGSINLRVFTSQERESATGTIRILAVDEENRTISGTFSGTLEKDTDTSTTLEITNGLFNQIPY